MMAQGLSGITKDLTKISSKSAIKFIVPEDAHSTLFKWVAALTGSKNTLKGTGFFLGSSLLAAMGFEGALRSMAGGLAIILAATFLLLSVDIGKEKSKVKFKSIFSKTHEINLLSATRFFLFGARDVWFVVGIAIFFYDVLDWSFMEVGGFLAIWVIGYGVVQIGTPNLLRHFGGDLLAETRIFQRIAYLLAAVPVTIVMATRSGFTPSVMIIGGLAVFGVLFALNSSLNPT